MQKFRKRNISVQTKYLKFAIEIEIQSQCSHGFHSEFTAFDAQCSTRAVEGRNKNHLGHCQECCDFRVFLRVRLNWGSVRSQYPQLSIPVAETGRVVGKSSQRVVTALDAFLKLNCLIGKRAIRVIPRCFLHSLPSYLPLHIYSLTYFFFF